MSRGPQVEVEGARELRASLKRAGVAVTQLKEAHREVASTVVTAVSPPHLSGSLAASIRPGATATAALARAGGSRVPYAGPIHWGWPARNIQAQPFLADAAQQTEPVWVAQYEAAVDRVLETVKGDPHHG